MNVGEPDDGGERVVGLGFVLPGGVGNKIAGASKGDSENLGNF